MNSSVVVSVLVSLMVGGAIGGSVTRFVMTAEVTCSTAPVAAVVPDNGMAKLLAPKQIPLTGYRSY